MIHRGVRQTKKKEKKREKRILQKEKERRKKRRTGKGKSHPTLSFISGLARPCLLDPFGGVCPTRQSRVCSSAVTFSSSFFLFSFHAFESCTRSARRPDRRRPDLDVPLLALAGPELKRHTLFLKQQHDISISLVCFSKPLSEASRTPPGPNPAAELFRDTPPNPVRSGPSGTAAQTPGGPPSAARDGCICFFVSPLRCY